MGKLMIWLAVIVIILLMGLEVVKEPGVYTNQRSPYTTCYGYRISPELSAPVEVMLIGQYKYHLIVATFLIGFALFMTFRHNP